jgi:hypothetical protein
MKNTIPLKVGADFSTLLDTVIQAAQFFNKLYTSIVTACYKCLFRHAQV